VEELHGDPTVGPRPKVWTEVKNGRSSAKDGAPERLRCGIIQKEVSKILLRGVHRRCKKNSLSALSCIGKSATRILLR